MARIKTGSIVADIAGKVGDNIYSRNAAGPYVRAYAFPTIPYSEFRDAAREAMALGSADWASLSDAERLNWASFSRQLKSPSFHNGHRSIDPRNTFLACKMHLYYCSIFDNPLPVFPVPSPLSSLSLLFPSSSEMLLNLDGTAASEDLAVILKGAIGLSPAVMSRNSVPFYWFATIAWDGPQTIDIASAFTARIFGTVPSGDERAFVNADVIHLASGIKIGSLWCSSLGYSLAYPYALGHDSVFALNTNAAPGTVMPFVAPGSGIVNTMYWYSHVTSQNVRFGIYSDDSGAPDALLGKTNLVANSASAGWKNTPLISPVNITAGNTYWIAMTNSFGSPLAYESFTSGAYTLASGGTDFTDPAPAISSINRRLSVYALVEAV